MSPNFEETSLGRLRKQPVKNHGPVEQKKFLPSAERLRDHGLSALATLKTELVVLKTAMDEKIETCLKVIDGVLSSTNALPRVRDTRDSSTMTEKPSCSSVASSASVSVEKPNTGTVNKNPREISIGSLFSSGPSTSSTASGNFRRTVFGTARESRLSAQTRTVELFLSNVRKGTSLADIFDFLGSKVKILRAEMVSHSDARAQSYVLTVPIQSMNFVMRPDFWPCGISCRPFVRPRSGRLSVASVFHE